MRLTLALSILTDLRLAIGYALLPTIKALLKDPRLIWHISSLFMAHVWEAFGPGTDANGKQIKEGLITPYAEGTILDLGAGHGHTVNYLDHTKLKRYIALEPNNLMHPHIRNNANKAGYHEADGSLLILHYGAQDTEAILAAIGSPIDTIVSVLTLCTVPDPKNTIRNVIDHLLKPGGVFLYYEHVLSHRKDVAWWQRLWTPVWALAFDGCNLDRPTDLWIDGAAVWNDKKVWGKEGETEENLFWHRAGKYVKALAPIS